MESESQKRGRVEVEERRGVDVEVVDRQRKIEGERLRG